MENNNVTFPQADDFEKILVIVNISNPNDLFDKSVVSKALGDISDRQVMYYLSACEYLGLITHGKVFTNLGNEIRDLKQGGKQNIELARLIISNKIFGTVFFYDLMFKTKFSISDISDVLRKQVPNLSDEVYKRRSQTVRSWIDWIHNEFDDHVD